MPDELDAMLRERGERWRTQLPSPRVPHFQPRRSRQRSRVLVAVAVFATIVVGASALAVLRDRSRNEVASTSTSTATLALPPTGNSTASLTATARAWAKAFLVGQLSDIKALQGPECADRTGTTLPAEAVTAYLQGQRAVMERAFGRPLDRIEIRDVLVRNVTSTQGEALVRYNLPAAVVGNDNWVTYAIHDGRWKVSDCRAPIGGSSASASSSGPGSTGSP